MARIRIPDYGNSTAPVIRNPGQIRTPGPLTVPGTTVPGVSVPAGAFISGDVEGARSLERGAHALMADERNDAQRDRNDVEQRELQAQVNLQRERFHEEQQAERNRAAASFATYQTELESLTTGLSTRLTEGQLNREDAPKELDKGLEALKKTHLAALSPPMQQALADNLIRLDGHTKTQLEGVLHRHARQERAGNANASLEAFSRLSDPTQAVAQAGTLRGELSALYGADKAGTMLQQFTEQKWASHFTGRLNQSRQDGRALQVLERDIVASKELDEDKKNVLLGRVAGFKETLAAAGERAARSRERTLVSSIEARDKMTLMGFPPTAEQDMTMLAAAKGTPYEPVVKAQIQFQQQTNDFRLAPPLKRQEFINNFEAQLRTNPSPDGAQTLAKYRDMDRSLTKVQSEDIISFAAQNNLARVAPIDVSQIATIGDQLNARLSIWRGMRAQYGGTSGLLMQAEIDQFQTILEGAPPKQKAEVLKTIAKAVRDPVALRDTAAQIAPKDRALGTAMFLAAQDNHSARGRNIAEDYLIGVDAINTKQAKIDDARETGLRATFSKALEGVYATTTGRDVAVDVAMKLYASGRVTGNGFDSETRAIEMATGGLMEVNGGKIAKPYGWSDSQFRDGLGAITPQKITAQAGGVQSFQAGSATMTAEQLVKILPSARLQTVDNGKYAIIAGPDYVRLPDRRPLLIDVR